MINRPLTLAGLDCVEISFGYSIESLFCCCAQACDAASEGRHSAAYELFQNALIFFERAKQVRWNDRNSGDLYLWQHAWQLSRALSELDKCAAVIYTKPDVTNQKYVVNPDVLTSYA